MAWSKCHCKQATAESKTGRIGGGAVKDRRLSGNEILSALGLRLVPALIGRDNCMAWVSLLILISHGAAEKRDEQQSKQRQGTFSSLHLALLRKPAGMQVNAVQIQSGQQF